MRLSALAFAILLASTSVMAQTQVSPVIVNSTQSNGAPIYCAVGNTGGACSLPISGTVTATPGADLTASGTITTQNLNSGGTATAGSAVSIAENSVATCTIQVTGTYTASGGLTPQITTDGTNWITQNNASLQRMSTGGFSATIPSAATGIWQIETAGHQSFRITALGAVTGTATITLRCSTGPSQVENTALGNESDAASVGSIDGYLNGLYNTIFNGAAVAGTAGTPSAGVVTVQGVTSGTPVQTQGSVASAASDSGNPDKIGGVYTSGPTAVTTGQRVNAWSDPFGNLGRSNTGGGITFETASATGTTGATTATLAASAGKTTYICGFSVASEATSGGTGQGTVTGIITGTMTFQHNTTTATVSIGKTDWNFGNYCMPASGTNTTIAVAAPAAGSGGNETVNAWGFQQ